MVENHEEQLSPKEILHNTIQGYFDTHLYGHRKTPFILFDVVEYELVKQVRPESNAQAVILINVEEEDISEIDKEWLVGLREVGNQFEMELHLPSWYFEK